MVNHRAKVMRPSLVLKFNSLLNINATIKLHYILIGPPVDPFGEEAFAKFGKALSTVRRARCNGLALFI